MFSSFSIFPIYLTSFVVILVLSSLSLVYVWDADVNFFFPTNMSCLLFLFPQNKSTSIPYIHRDFPFLTLFQWNPFFFTFTQPNNYITKVCTYLPYINQLHNIKLFLLLEESLSSTLSVNGNIFDLCNIYAEWAYLI